MENKKLLDQFRGVLVGALIGDCLGNYFEDVDRIEKNEIASHIDRTEKGKATNIELTDDSQMTQELADSLIEHKQVNVKDLARRFTERYYLDGQYARYGANVIDVFAKLKYSNYDDPLQPAKQQFRGSGSYGNGAAMRVSPIPLFAFPDLQKTVQLAEESSTVTHTHILGRHGAVLEALAIRRALLSAPVSDVFDFLTGLRADCKEVNICQEYLHSLDTIEQLLNKNKIANTEVILKLGNNVTAQKSVPTALFCFLRALQPVCEISGNCSFRRAVEYAINMEGDTDTIASMAGAIAGANVGLSSINSNTVHSCPDHDKAIQQADSLFNIVTNS